MFIYSFQGKKKVFQLFTRIKFSWQLLRVKFPDHTDLKHGTEMVVSKENTKLPLFKAIL